MNSAFAPARERAPEPPEEKRREWLWPLLLALLFQLALIAYAYGGLVERVDNVQSDVREIKQQLREMRR